MISIIVDWCLFQILLKAHYYESSIYGYIGGNGEFTTASIYKWLGEATSRRHSKWKQIWRLQIPERVPAGKWHIFFNDKRFHK